MLSQQIVRQGHSPTESSYDPFSRVGQESIQVIEKHLQLFNMEMRLSGLTHCIVFWSMPQPLAIRQAHVSLRGHDACRTHANVKIRADRPMAWAVDTSASAVPLDPHTYYLGYQDFEEKSSRLERVMELNKVSDHDFKILSA